MAANRFWGRAFFSVFLCVAAAGCLPPPRTAQPPDPEEQAIVPPDAGAPAAKDVGPGSGKPDAANGLAGPPPLPKVPVLPEVAAATGANYFVVSQDNLLPAATDHAKYREAQGYKTLVLSVSDLVSGPVDPLYLRNALAPQLDALRAALPPERPLFLVLYGDAPPGTGIGAPGSLPPHPCADNNFIPPSMCYTDNAYADLDGDLLPDAAVGRIAVHNLAEGAAYLATLKAFESSYETGSWNRRVAIYSGGYGYGAVLDGMLEGLAMSALTYLSHDLDITGLYANPDSAWYDMPVSTKLTDLVSAGNLAVLFIANGATTGIEGLSAAAVTALTCAHRQPFAFFFCPMAGNFAASIPSIAEAMVANPKAALAAFAPVSQTHPYSTTAIAYESQRAIFDGRLPTIGEVVAQAKRWLILHSDPFRREIEVVAAINNIAEPERVALNRVHLELYNLIGDPATSMRYPQGQIAFDGPPQGTIDSGSLAVAGKVPGLATGTALVTLECERDVILGTLEPFDPKAPDAATAHANWAKTVNKVAVSMEVPVQNGAFAATLTWQDKLPVGTWWIKVYAQGGGSDGMGSIQVP